MNLTSKFAAIAALSLTAALAAPAAGHATPLDTSKTYRITTSKSLALDIAGASRGDGAALVQWPVNGGRNQQWRFEPWGIGYRIVNVNSGKCLTAPGGNRARGTKIVQWICGRAGQDWYALAPMFAGYSSGTIFSFQSGLGYSDNPSLDVPGDVAIWGTQLGLWPSNAGANQSFVLTAV